MKALILAAGLGTRLKPLTNNIPKPLVLIGRKPLLKYTLDGLLKYDINDICLNSHYLAHKIDDFVKGYKKWHPKINIKVSFEKKLLGTAGTLRNNYEFFCKEKNFFIIYGDNLTNINYQKLFNFHLNKKSFCTIACYYENHPEGKGIIEFDKDKRINKFIEKPAQGELTSHYANAGIYVFNQKIFRYINSKNFTSPFDLGKDVFPYLLKKGKNVYAYLMDEFLLDIGTLNNYNLAQTKVKEIF